MTPTHPRQSTPRRRQAPAARLAAALVLTAAWAGTATAQEGDDAKVAAYVAAAQSLAGDDLTTSIAQCGKIGPLKALTQEQIDTLLMKLVGKEGQPPTKVFDNLYFVGTDWVSAWALQTDDGIILIDALNNTDEAKTFIEDGLTELGLDPADIRTIIVTHGHGDHYGGAKYLAQKYGAQVVMSEVDWTEVAKPTLQFDSPLWDRPPERDVVVADSQQVMLGDTAVTVYVTAGHTPGTVSLILPVKDGEETHKAILWGGNGFNFGPISERFVSYIEAAGRFADLARDEGVDVYLSNHPGSDDSAKNMPLVADRKAGEAHPFVLGTDDVVRFMQGLKLCAQANLANFDAAAVPD